MKIAYVRVSTQEQNFDRQLELLKPYEIERVFREKQSGKDMSRERLNELLEFVRQGDEVYVESWSRLSRTVSDLLKIFEMFDKWSELLEGEKYIIEKVPSKLAEDDNYSIAVEQFLAKHKEEFKVKDNSKQLAHIKMIKAADVVIGFPSVNILEPYVKLLDRYNKNFIIGGYVNEDNFSDYLKAFEMRRFEITSVENMRYKEFFCEFNGSLIWMDNFDKVTPYYSTDSGYGYEEDGL